MNRINPISPRDRITQVVDAKRSATDLFKKIVSGWNSLPPPELAEQIIDLEGRVAHLPEGSPLKKKAERLHFQFVFPLALDIVQKSSFVRIINRAAARVFQTQSLTHLQELNPTQQREVLRDRVGTISPEGLSDAMQKYIHALQHQAAVAESFFFGRLQEGMEGLLKLPADVQLKIDQLIWDAAGGAPIDPTEKESQSLIAAAIMHSVEERMGMMDEAASKEVGG